MPNDPWAAAVNALDNHFNNAAGEKADTINGSQITQFDLVVPMKGNLVFVDGGNGALFDSPSAAVHLVRLAAVRYDGTQRCSTQRSDVLCIVTRDATTVRVAYDNDNFPAFALEGSTTIEQAVDIGRRVAEKITGARVATPDVCVVFDGDLRPRHALEKQVLAGILTPHCALTKTTTMLTDNGKSVPGTLQSKGPADAWHFPLTDTLCCVKLHRSAARAFLLEARGMATSVVAAALATQNDPAFPGYPHGLVEADLLARVTVAEQRALAESLRTRLRGKWESHSGALDSHDVLDRIAGNRDAAERF